LLGSNGIGTGRDTFENEIINQAGWQNYLTAKGYIQLDLEQIASNPPDAILWSAPAKPALANRFAENPILKQRMLNAGELQSNYWRWQCPGPWSWALIEQLKQWKK
jgi:iron complex transport system substrate-binding protein